MATAPTSYSSALIESLRGQSSDISAPGVSLLKNPEVTARKAPPLKVAKTDLLFRPEVLTMPEAPPLLNIFDGSGLDGLVGDDLSVSTGGTFQDEFLGLDSPVDVLVDGPVDDGPADDPADETPVTDTLFSDKPGVTPPVVDEPVDPVIPGINLDSVDDPETDDPLDGTADSNVPQIVVIGQRPTDDVLFEPDDQYIDLTLDEVLPKLPDIVIAPEKPAPEPETGPDAEPPVDNVPQIVIQAPTRSVPEPTTAPEPETVIDPEDLFIPPSVYDVVIPEFPSIDLQSPDQGLIDAVLVAEEFGIPAPVSQDLGITPDTTISVMPIEEPQYDPILDVLFVPDQQVDGRIDAEDNLLMEEWV